MSTKKRAKNKAAWFPAVLLTVFLAAAGTLSADGAETAKTAEEVWQQCLENAGRYKNYIPGRTDITVEILSPKGESEQRYDLTAVTTVGPGGRISREVSGLESLPEDMRRQAANRDGGGMQAEQQRGLNPFLPKAQSRLSITDQEPADSVEGRSASVYSLQWTDDRGMDITGMVWIDRDTGLPLRLIAQPEKPPGPVKELTMDTYFSIGDGPWVPMRTVVHQTVRKSLFSSRSIRSTMLFSQFIDTKNDQNR